MSKTIYILGGGESGTGAALLAKKLGYSVLVSDAGKLKPQFRNELEEEGIAFEEEGHGIVKQNIPDLVIKSPGIPPSADIVTHFLNNNCEVISEIEFGVRNCGDSRFIAITGTNGKTTTTLLTYHILKQAGRNVGLTGNIGTSLARQIAMDPKSLYVVELSSFQLDDLYSLHAETAIITNITPDHLDRYDNDFNKYRDSKFRILQNMNPDNYFIFFKEDNHVVEEINSREIKCRKQDVSLSDRLSSTYKSEAGLKLGEGCIIPWDKVTLKGDHNYLNIMMACRAALNQGLSCEELISGVSSFVNIPHRLEWIADINGISFVNDSKATNVDSVYYALGAFNTPITWIAGGVDKGNNYTQLNDLVRSKVRSLICLGTDNNKLKMAFENLVGRIVDTTDIKAAARLALKYSEKNDTVLLSPACASFDLFLNYEDRGEKFREAVLELKKEIENNKN